MNSFLRRGINYVHRILKNFSRRFNLFLLYSYFKGKKVVENNLSHQTFSASDLYCYFEFKFLWRAPFWLRKHRKYFSQENRGFGELPFHAAWNDIIVQLKPRTALEIGVYRGQVISLWQLIASKNKMQLEVYGVSPLKEIGDSVSLYLQLNYRDDIATNFAKFRLTKPNLIEALSTDPKAVEFINSKKWDLIYIDGGHDLETVLHDYKVAVTNLSKGGILCLDDSSLYHTFTIDGVFKGHPGPSKVVRDYALKDLKYFMTVGHNNFFIKP